MLVTSVIMKYILFTLIKLVFVICNSSEIENGADLQCKNLDFQRSFNISVQNKIVIVYNSALCIRCAYNLLLLKVIQNRFKGADYKDLVFILLTTKHSQSTEFDEIKSGAENLTVISLHDIYNEYFVPEGIYIFDRCHRVSYELVPPWSSTHYQILKAAILSTWYDLPCGECEEKNLANPQNETLNMNSNTNTSNFLARTFNNFNRNFVDDNENNVEDSSYVIPMRIVIPIEHVHPPINGSRTMIKYNFMVLQTNNHSFHGHISSDNTEVLTEKREVASDPIDHKELGNPLDNDKFVLKRILVSSKNEKYKVVKPTIDTGTESELNMDDERYFEEVFPIYSVKVIKTTNPPMENESNNINKVRSSSNSSTISALYPWLAFRLIKKN